jgi:hypothetical protein
MHEALLELFRNQPALAVELLRALKVPLPRYTRVVIDSADLTNVQPAEYRADLVAQLLNDHNGDGKLLMGLVVEVQLSRDARKPFVWAAYVSNLCVRLNRPVCLLVFAADEATARWAAKGVDLGGGNHFTPVVIGPAGVPVITSKAQAQANPELAVLSVMAHGRGKDARRSLRIAEAALAAVVELDDKRLKYYVDLIFYALEQGVRKELKAMALTKYEYQSDFARKYVAQGVEKGREEGREKGRAEGRAALLTELLALRFGPLPEPAQKRLSSASIEQLDEMGRRLLSANTLNEVLNLN